MGRGNSCTTGKYEGLYYLDYDFWRDSDGAENEFFQWDYEEDMAAMLHAIQQRFPSFAPCDTWIGRDAHAVLENGLFYVALEDNVWSVAVKLLQKEDWYGNLEGLQAGLYQRYLIGIKALLLGMFGKIGAYGGPWTHVILTA